MIHKYICFIIDSYKILSTLPCVSSFSSWASLVAQMVKNMPGMQETQVQSLGQEHPPEKGMANHSSSLVWRTPWPEEPVGYSPGGAKSQFMTEHFLVISARVRL